MTRFLLKGIRQEKILSYYLIVFFTCIQSFILTFAVAEVIKYIISNILEGTKEISFILFEFIGLYFVYALLCVLNKKVCFRYIKYATKKIEQTVLKHLCKLDEWESDYDGLKILALISNDIYQIASMKISLLTQRIGIYTSIFFGMLYGLRTNIYVSLCCIVVTDIIFHITKKVYPKLKEYEYHIGNEFNKNYANINEIINNIGIIHLLNSKKVVRNFQGVAKRNVDLNIDKGRVFAYVYICKKISNFFLVFLTCFLGVIQMGTRRDFAVVVSEISALAYLMPNIATKVMEIIDLSIQKNNLAATEKRIDAIFEIKKYNQIGKASIQGISQISVENLSFSYEDKKIISALSFKMNSGRITAFRGVSGCGKSTLLKLLCRVIPVEDNMIFINSQDINTIERTSIWDNIGYVSQNSHIVKGTIRENILAEKEYNQEQFQEVLVISTLNDTLHNFKDGSEQVIDENKVSSGERQKIALARALYKQPDFLCLDEVVSAMDPLSQKKVLERLANYVKRRNILCAYVSHVTEEKECTEIEEIWL